MWCAFARCHCCRHSFFPPTIFPFIHKSVAIIELCQNSKIEMESSRLHCTLCNEHTWMRFHLFAKCAKIGAIIALLPTCNGSIIVIKNYYNLFHFKTISHIVLLLLLRFYFAFVAVIHYCYLYNASFSCLLSAALNRCYLRISIFIALLLLLFIYSSDLKSFFGQQIARVTLAFNFYFITHLKCECCVFLCCIWIRLPQILRIHNLRTRGE